MKKNKNRETSSRLLNIENPSQGEIFLLPREDGSLRSCIIIGTASSPHILGTEVRYVIADGEGNLLDPMTREELREKASLPYPDNRTLLFSVVFGVVLPVVASLIAIWIWG